MAVSSPYAVFKAAELVWPRAKAPSPLEPSAATERTHALQTASSAPARRRCGKRMLNNAGWNTMVQGELLLLA